jgi:hypothetical protein
MSSSFRKYACLSQSYNGGIQLTNTRLCLDAWWRVGGTCRWRHRLTIAFLCNKNTLQKHSVDSVRQWTLPRVAWPMWRIATAVISAFYNGTSLFISSISSVVITRRSGPRTPFQTRYFSENLVASRIEPRPLYVARNSDHYSTEEVYFLLYNI